MIKAVAMGKVVAMVTAVAITKAVAMVAVVAMAKQLPWCSSYHDKRQKTANKSQNMRKVCVWLVLMPEGLGKNTTHTGNFGNS